MKTTQKNLQKLTKVQVKINDLMKNKNIAESDLNHFSRNDKDKLGEYLTKLINSSKGTERDELLYKLEAIIPKDTKNQLWENNHIIITGAISSLMQEYGRMPTKTEIATKTELSRQTIHKHLKDYTDHPQYLIFIEQFKIMTSKVLAKVFKYAVNGDVGAAKLYLNVMGCLNNGQGSKMIKNQNNYIQINGTILSQETLKNLKPEQLDIIETILKTALPNCEVLEESKILN